MSIVQHEINEMTHGRIPFHLSLRTEDQFEKMLAWAIKGMPRGYAKLFFVRIARLFGRDVKNKEELFRLMWDFVVDVQPLRLALMPDVDLSEQPPRPSRGTLPYAVATLATASRELADVVEAKTSGQVRLPPD